MALTRCADKFNRFICLCSIQGEPQIIHAKINIMKHCGNYCPVDCPYDLDHEINRMVAMVAQDIAEIDDNGKKKNKRAIVKAMIAELMESI